MKIPITKPYFTEEEKDLMCKPLETGWVVQGPYAEKLEGLFAEYTGARYAVAFNSCTSAQLAASACIGLEPRDEVIVPAFTWISTANAAEFRGAVPVFTDIELETFNIDAEGIRDKITKKTKAVFPVNLFGLPADLDRIRKIAGGSGLKIVEDCACSLGGYAGKTHTGTFGDCGCFSMHPRKAITTGEGGMLVTGSKEIAGRARSFRNHGAAVTDLSRHKDCEGYLLGSFDSLGYNLRLTDIQAALGVAQFGKLDYILKRRNDIAATYTEELSQTGLLKTPSVPKNMKHGWQSYVCLFMYDEILKIKKSRDYGRIDELHEKRNLFMRRLADRGIAVRQGTHAVHIQGYYSRKYGIDRFGFINSYIADRLSLALPVYPQMTEAEQGYVIDSIKELAGGNKI
ncbi:MAG: DegT/DnrJ/EryC1/StrS family aminotransferase [Elusimicrobia bacterium]|nr:DegT/DnrJ/EryC1/StrS family aminotransferase [Elusimicrobiota bacterium]